MPQAIHQLAEVPARPSLDEFEADGDLTVRHVPTGNRYSIYPASNPAEFYAIRLGALSPRGADGETYCLEDLCALARRRLQRMLLDRRGIRVAASPSLQRPASRFVAAVETV